MTGIIHQRIQTLKQLSGIQQGGETADVPPHGATHVKEGTDPVPPEIDGIPVEMDGIVDGSVPTFDEGTGKFIPGAGTNGVTSASNVGTGIGVFRQKTGLNLEFKSLVTDGTIEIVGGVTEVQINLAPVVADQIEENTDQIALNTPQIAQNTGDILQNTTDIVGLGEDVTEALTALSGEATTWETHGWKYRFSFNPTFDNATRTLTVGLPTIPYNPPTVDPFYDWWRMGVYYKKTVAESIQIPDEEGTFLVYYDLENLAYVKNPTQSQIATSMREEIFVAYVYWNAVDKVAVRLRYEGHTRGFAPSVHAWGHFGFGALYFSGLGLNGFTIGAGSDISHIQWGMESGVFADEDLPHFPPSVTPTAGGKVLYNINTTANPWLREADGLAGTWLLFEPGGRLLINERVGSNWELNEADDKSYVVYHMLVDNSVDEGDRWFSRPGTAQYNSLADAEAGLVTEARDLGLADRSELGHVASIILYTRNTYAVKAKVVPLQNGAEWFDWRTTSAGGGSSGGSALLLGDLINVNDNATLDGEFLSKTAASGLWEGSGKTITDIGNALQVLGYEIDAIGDTMPSLGLNVTRDWDMEDTGTAEWVGTSGGVDSKDTSVYKIGTQSLKCRTLTGDSSGGVYQDIDVEIGDTVVLGFWYRIDANAEEFRYRFGNGAVINLTPTKEEWQYLQVEGTFAGTTLLIFYGYKTTPDVDFDVWVDGVTVHKVQTASTNNILPTYWARENQVVRPTEFNVSPWFLDGGGSIDSDGYFITSTTASYQRIRQAVNLSDESVENSVDFHVEKGAAPYAYLRILAGATDQGVFVNLETMETPTIYGSLVVFARMLNNRIVISVVPTLTVDTARTIYISPAASAGVTSYAGDGSNFDIRITKVHQYTGIPQDGIGFFDNGANEYPLTIKQETRDDFQLRHANGQVLTASGAWEFVENVNGFLMDESPSNVVAMRQAGLYKMVNGGTWGPLVEGVQFYANNASGNFYEKFTGNYSNDGGLLTPSATPPVHPDPQFDYYASPVHSTGQVITESVVLEVNTYVSDTEKNAVSTSDTNLGMRLSCAISRSYGDITYDLKIEYKWAEITPWT